MYLVFDGGNHGHKVMAGYGSFRFYRYKGGELLNATLLEYSGLMTNNEAEYRTLLEALKYMRAAYIVVTPLVIEGDSELVRKQVLGEWQVSSKGQHLKPYLNQIRDLLQGITYTYLHVPRAEIVAVLGH
jgi:ribonuclease HI